MSSLALHTKLLSCLGNAMSEFSYSSYKIALLFKKKIGLYKNLSTKKTIIYFAVCPVVLLNKYGCDILDK